MDLTLTSWVLLIVVTAFGAVAQSAIGFGFSLMTVPFYLLLLEVRDAVQLGMILTLVVTITVVAKIHQDIPKQTATNLITGSVVGFPLGLVFFIYASPDLIKSVVAVTILIVLANTVIKARNSSVLAESRANGITAGIISGSMVTSIAMAGPAIAVYMQALQAGKVRARATMLGVFLFSYPCAIFMQAYFNGIGSTGLKVAMWLLPVVLVGTYAGHHLSGFLSEKLFNRLISLILVVIALYLLFSVF